MIFISYRRDDTSGVAGRIFDRLKARFGANAVCRDVDSFSAGEDFIAEIRQRIERSQVLLALIGPRWLTAADEGGRLRLADAGDLVRLEIVTALERNIRVIPVLLHGAAMPQEKEMPAELAALTRRNAVEIRDTSFDQDVERLVALLGPAWHHRAARTLKRRPVFAGVFVLALAWAGIWAYPHVVNTPEKARSELARMRLEYNADTLVQSAAKNDATAVELFLRAGMPADAPNRRGDTSLMVAAGKGHLPLVKRLVEKGADVNRALSWAVGHPEVLSLLLAQKPRADAINSALISAAGRNTESMQALLDAGADVNFQDKDSTALSEAARSLNAKSVQVLLSRGAKVDPDFKEGWLPLHNAIYHPSSLSDEAGQRQFDIVKALLDKRASMEARTRSMPDWQPTPLLLAIQSARPRVALLLIERGADVNARTIDPGRNERTALIWAAEKGLTEVVQALIAKGAPVDGRNDRGETALIVAPDGLENFGRNQPAVAKALLAAGADINARTARGGTALMRAAGRANGVLEVLLEHGADVNLATNAGWTALMVAADAREKANIALLLSKGADRQPRNADGLDAEALALKAGSKEAAQALSVDVSRKSAQNKVGAAR